MKKQTTLAIAAVTALLAIATPIAASLYLAQIQSQAAQSSQLDNIAEETLQHMEQIADETFSMFKIMKSEGSKNPCSTENIRLMRRIVMRTDQLKAVGYVKNNHLLCSSFGRHDIGSTGIDLGPVAYKSPLGSEVRAAVKFDEIPNRTFLTSTDSATGYTSFMQPEKALLLNQAEISSAVFFGATNTLLVSNGQFNAGWMTLLGKTSETRFSNDGYLISFKKSKRYTFSSLAAVRLSLISEKTTHVAKFMIPAGIGASLLLVLIVLSATRYYMSTRALIKAGLRRHEFFMVYQPIMEIASGRCVGAEALIRWRSNDGKLVSPDLFIPVAEESGLIHEITKEVLQLVAQDTGQLLRERADLHISINLSAKDLMMIETVQLLRKLIADLNIRPANIIVEATERGIMQTDIARQVIDELHAIELQIAIDDFGTGYSSLSYLNNFKLDYLKIDKSFVETMGGEAATSQVASHIIKMANSLNLQMIAEGVETEQQLEYLKQNGVQYAQGYLFSKPLNFVEFEKLVRDGGN